MKLFHIAGCPYGWRTRIVLGEKEIPFETVLFERGERPPELAALSPDAKSPTLIDGDVKIWESLVVNEYLEDRYPERPLLPPDPALRAEVRVLVHEIEKKLMPPTYQLTREMFFKPIEQRDPATVEKLREAWREALAVHDARLAGRRFLHGDQLSLADVMLYTPLASTRRFTSEEPPGSMANLRAWRDRMAGRPSIRSPVPADA
jgi:glutathione S-transferase